MLDLSRQSELVPSTISDTQFLIIGAGSLGSSITNVIARMGARQITLYDPDILSEENIAPSFASKYNVGYSKTGPVQAMLSDQLGIRINTYEHAFFRQQHDADVVITAVESMNVRRSIWQSHRINYKLWIDARMGNDQAGVYTHLFGAPTEVYELTLSRPGEELACGQKATAPISVGLVPGFAGTIVMRYLNNLPIPSEIFVKVLMEDMFMSFGKPHVLQEGFCAEVSENVVL